jgi:hypothetical protein
MFKNIIKVSIFVLFVYFASVPFGRAWAEPFMQLQVIEAQQGKQFKVSPELKPISATLKASFTRYQNYKHLQTVCFAVQPRVEKVFHLTKGLDFAISVKSVQDSMITLEVNVPQKKMIHVVKAKLGKLFFEAIKWKGKVYLIAFLPKN